MHNTLKPANLDRYLKYDLIDVIQISFLLTGHEPVGLSEFFLRHPEYPDQHGIYDMAKASITAKKIEGEGSDTDFATSPMNWLRWADSKGLILPELFRKAYDEYKETKKKTAPRPNGAYRPIEETERKYVIQQLMKTILEFIPNLPLKQLVKTPPIQRNAGDSTDETLESWGREIGAVQGRGRPSNKIKEECTKLIPKCWNFKWEDKIS